MLRKIIIKTLPGEERIVLDQIHNLLAGREDYVRSDIVLNGSSARRDGTKDEVHLYITKGSQSTLKLEEDILKLRCVHIGVTNLRFI